MRRGAAQSPLVRRSHAWRAAAVALAFFAACSSAPLTREGPAAPVRELTGARTRVVWVQGDGTDTFAEGDDLVLMGFDTDDGRGERVILGERRNYRKPLLTPRGDRIVFTSRSAPDRPEVVLVNWDGSDRRRLVSGFALAVWADPAGGREWIYAGADPGPDSVGVIERFPIDDPSAREVVWDRTRVTVDTFQVSADGGMAAGLFPWPEAGVAELPNGALHRLGDGCWTALADAGRPLFWLFDGSHRNLILVDLTSERRWKVAINQAPGFAGAEVYHPRWTNHPRFMVISGPYNQGGDNQVRSGGAQADVHLGRFNRDFTAIEAWARVTDNAGGDAFPDVWIDRRQSAVPAGTASVPGPGAAPTSGHAPEAGTTGGARAEPLVVEARLVRAGPVPSPRSIEPYRQALVVSTYEIVSAPDGADVGRTILVAEWAIRDGRVLAGARKTAGSVRRLRLEPYEAHPELEGERLIIESDAPDLPLYYDTGS